MVSAHSEHDAEHPRVRRRIRRADRSETRRQARARIFGEGAKVPEAEAGQRGGGAWGAFRFATKTGFSPVLDGVHPWWLNEIDSGPHRSGEPPFLGPLLLAWRMETHGHPLIFKRL